MAPAPQPFSVPRAAIDRCEAEPIHRIGKVQPHGTMIVLTPGGTVAGVADNFSSFFDVEPGEVLFSRPEIWAPPLLRSLFATEEEAPRFPAPRLVKNSRGERLEVLAYRFRNHCFLEITPAASDDRISSSDLMRATSSLLAANSFDEFTDRTVRALAPILDFDRAVVYTFHEDGTGEVIAEYRQPEQEPFLGLRYPSFDVPRNSRRLLRVAHLSHTADTAASNVPLRWRSGMPGDLDLSFSRLRGHSENCLGYYRNMGVGAALVLPLFVEGSLWGMLNFHNREPRAITFDEQGRILLTVRLLERHIEELRIGSRRASRTLDRTQIHRAVGEATRSIKWPELDQRAADELTALIPADAIITCDPKGCHAIGISLPEECPRQLHDWLIRNQKDSVYTTDFLRGQAEISDAVSEALAGLLSIRLSSDPASFLVWVRRPEAEQVRWAGEPQKEVEVDEAGNYILSTRNNFAAWLEERRDRCRRWTERERGRADIILDSLRDILKLHDEESLRKAELDVQRLRAALENSTEAVLISRPDRRVAYANRVFREIFADAESLEIEDDLAPRFTEPQQWHALLEERDQHTRASSPSLVVRSRGSLPLHLSVTTHHITHPTGESAGTLTIFTDLTAIRALEEERRHLDRRIHEVQKIESLTVLAGGIAHDFNNLLVGILGAAGLALLETPPESPARSSIQLIEDTAQRAADLTKQMLAYSGRGRFILENISLTRLVEEMAHLLESIINRKAVLRLDLEPNLTPVEGDATQLRQIIMNLIINASEAIGNKSGVISIHTGLVDVDDHYLSTLPLAQDARPGTFAFVEVSDTGAGMDLDTMARIFDPFFTTKEKGSGLGLAAVLGIVRAHRGFVKVYSNPGAGTSFKIGFPVAEAVVTQDEEATEPSDRRIAHTILVIDDEVTVRTVTKAILERFGHKVILASDGRDGLERWKQHKEAITLICLDMSMPHLNGEETYREMRHNGLAVPVLLMSGYNQQEAVNRFTGKGLAGFVQKPFTPKTLLEAIKNATTRP